MRHSSTSSDRSGSANQGAEFQANGAFTASPLAISLPKDGGAIRGLGEKFAGNLVAGAGSMNVSVAASHSRSGFGPELALSNDPGAGNGRFGFGWSLTIPPITRKIDKGLPQYKTPRYLTYSSSPALSARIEGLFARRERWTNVNNSSDVHWRSISRDNVPTIYGKDENCRIADPSEQTRI
jgi:hypothetical protein